MDLLKVTGEDMLSCINGAIAHMDKPRLRQDVCLCATANYGSYEFFGLPREESGCRKYDENVAYR